MDERTFLGLCRADDGARWQLEVVPKLSTPGKFLFGGCGLAGAVAAMEEECGRPTVWAAAQYLSYAMIGSTVDYQVVVAAEGRHVTQVRAVAHVGDREILTVNAAVGETAIDLDETWEAPPPVPPPSECPRREVPAAFADTIVDEVEVRVARGAPYEHVEDAAGDPKLALWARVPHELGPSATTLAIFGDYVSHGLSQPLGRYAMTRSLDNTLRIVRRVPTEWVLCDIRMHATTRGYAHGTAFLWAEDGTLLGIASQSLGYRFREPDQLWT
jgi:acyl-CoA thioesterase II